MKADQLYQQLKELAEKLGIEVSEQSFKYSGIRVQSGFCRVKDQDRYIMDKNISIHRKNAYLAKCLAYKPLDDIYIVPAVRDYLEKYVPTAKLDKMSGNNKESR